MKKLILLLALLFAADVSALPVVPGAPNAAGMDTRAAYGNATNPTVYKITSLADSGAGTLRNAMEASGNRVIIFERSGEITLDSDIIVTSPYMTVAGQTAPDPGITVRRYGFQILSHDILIQHLRVRKGQEVGDIVCGNTFELYSANSYNIVLDHISSSWGQDEQVIVYNPSRAANFVIWRSIVAEGLNYTPGTESCGGGGAAGAHGLLVYDNTFGTTVAQSVFAKNHERNPDVHGDASVVMLNNLIYGWQGQQGILFVNFDHDGGAHGGPWYASTVGNRFIVNTTASESADYLFAYSPNGGTPTGNQIYRVDNTVANGSTTDEYQGVGYNPNVFSPPTLAPMPSGYSALSSLAVEAALRLTAGARPANRDSVDTRILNEIAARTSSVDWIQFPSDVGGWPTLAVNTRGLTVPTNPNSDDDGDGYTNLEEWLQGYALAVEGGPADAGPADVPAATGTIITSATFTGTSTTALTSYTSGTGGGWALQTGSTGVLAISNANDIMGTSTATSSLTYSLGVPLSANYDASADFVVKTIIPGNSYSLWVGVSPTQLTGYGIAYDTSSTSWTLFKFVNGTYTGLGSCFQTLSTSTTYRVVLRKRAASKHAVIDGVQCTSINDAEITTAGYGGLSVYHATADTNTTGIHYDNFLVQDVTTAAVSTMCSKCRLRFGTIH